MAKVIQVSTSMTMVQNSFSNEAETEWRTVALMDDGRMLERWRNGPWVQLPTPESETRGL